MNNSSSKPGSGRRNFLLAVGAGGAATVAAVVGKSLTKTVPGAKAEPSGGKGYQLTDHVRKYYQTTKI
jgi:hypothetical protein